MSKCIDLHEVDESAQSVNEKGQVTIGKIYSWMCGITWRTITDPSFCKSRNHTNCQALNAAYNGELKDED